MAKTSTADVYEALETFIVEIDGVPTRVERGRTRVHRSSPIYKSNPHLFKPLVVESYVEDATADPGVKRGEK